MMNIAFVTYPKAALLPPYHGSMGASIYMIAREFAQHSNVVVYGLADSQAGAKSGIYDGVEYRFVPSTASDRLLGQARRAASTLIPLATPISTSSALFPSYGRQVAADLATQKWDIIHIQHCTQYVQDIRRLNPTAKIILHIHTEWFSQSNFAVIARRLQGLDLLLTVSDYVTGKTQLNFPQVADRCETLYNGIDTSEFDHEKDYVAASNRKVKRVLYIGGIWPHKGAHVAIDAFKIVAQKHPDIVMDLVGPQGDYPVEEACDLKDRATLQRMAPYFKKKTSLFAKLFGRSSRSNGYLEFLKSKLTPELSSKVTFHGFVTRAELVRLYYDADVFVFPPVWNEAFGCTPLESMAAGVPVVVSRAGGIVETVQDQKTGFVVDPDDSAALAQAMLRLLEDDALRETMGRAARRRAQEFTWEAITNGMLNRYQALAGPRGRESRPAIPALRTERTERTERAEVRVPVSGKV
jgi:glycosyltransferase involved in cell wall biosynthesis